jgi:class 3 adenylate cyclase
VTIVESSTAPPQLPETTLPPWRRPRRLRRQLALTLAGTALVSLLTVGVLNFFAASALLTDGTREQLVSVAESRANSIETGVDRLVVSTSVNAADVGIVDAIKGLGSSFAELNSQQLSPAENTKLDAFYQKNFVEPLASIGFDGLTPEQLSPTSNAGRYLQYHYVVPTSDINGGTETVDAGDGSTYSEQHAQFHPYLSGLISSPAIDDVLLINRSGDIIYTAEKRIDLGASLREGLLVETFLADAALNMLPTVRPGEAVIADFELYLPAGAQPALFALAAVKDGTEVVGALAIGIKVDGLSAITTAGGDFDGVGLGDGESYVVGRDFILRSESRRWLEDPEEYLDSVEDPELARLMEILGSPIGLQPVETEPVKAALSGQTFAGSAVNYLGEKTFTYARPLDTAGVSWVVVAEQPIGELRAPLYTYAARLGLVLALILPLAALIGYFVADRLTRSIPPAVEMASAIAAGARDLDPPDLGANEFGDLTRRLAELAGELGQQEAALSAEFDQRRQLLLSVLPARLVMDEGVINGTGEANDVGTVIAITIEVDGEPDNAEVVEFLKSFGQAVESRAEQLDIDRIRSGHDRLLFLAGVNRPDDGASDAVDFVLELLAAAATVAEADSAEVTPVLHIGMSTGAVATGVLESGSITFMVWGEPVRRALAIGALSTANEILVDESVFEALDSKSLLHPATDIIALDGQQMKLFAVERR